MDSTQNSKSRIILITANVGTIFENLDELLEPWLTEFTNKIKKFKPEFIALHMQEIGGKNYKQSMQLIDPFFKKFLSHQVIQEYNRYLIAIDSDFTDENNFTSLCNVYLIHESLPENEIELYNFSDRNFFTYTSRQLFSGNLNNNHLIYKERYLKHFFQEFQWSRKGFIQTKWKIRKQNFDFVNIHLFHDPSNLVALTSTPSIYSENRRKALEYSIKKIKANQFNSNEPIIFSIFGDFNFRLDLATLIKDFANKSNSIEIKDDNNKLSKLVCKASHDKEIFTIEEKKFIWHYDSSIQSVKNDLLKYDIELSLCEEPLFEVEKNFPPSYPFMEELENPNKYMESRCPAWCDRIILNKSFKQILDKSSSNMEYGMIGENTCMGDHKPIYLYFNANIAQETNTSANDPVNLSNKNALNNNSNNNINTLKISLNYLFLNNTFVNLNDLYTDIHDNALFNNINLLKHLINYSSYANYHINNIKPPPQSNETLHLDSLKQNNNNSGLSKPSNSDSLVLNQWLNSIAELITAIHSSNNNLSCSECFLNKLNEANCNTLKQIDKKILFKSCLVNFFLKSLNGNFFKLKHLYSYLNDTVSSIKNELNTENNNDNNNIDSNNNKNIGLVNSISSNQISSQIIINSQNKIDDLNKPFDLTLKTLLILNEINKFLSMPCTLNIFKLAIYKNNLNKKYLLFNFNSNYNYYYNNNNKYTTTTTTTNNNNNISYCNNSNNNNSNFISKNKDYDLLDETKAGNVNPENKFVKNDSTNNNNNDENFTNMNNNTNLKSKYLISE